MREALRAAHGYTASSAPVQALVATLASYGPAQQRAFLAFVTGATALPAGGLAALQPRLTVVRKAAARPDQELPSVMTCQNYLKLPPYSSREVLAARLGYALAEGQGSFHLS